VTTQGPRGWTRTAVAIATLGLIAVFARSVDWRTAWATVTSANPTFVLMAVGANLGSVVIKALRWRMFLASVGVPSASLAFRATLAGAALNNVVFANGGDAARVAAVANHARASSADVLATLAVDKLCDLASYAIIFVAVAFALPLPAELARWRAPVLGALGLMFIAAVFVIWPARRAVASPDDVYASFVARARAYGRRLLRTLTEVATAPRLAVALLLAVAAWAGQWATFHFAARAAAFPASPVTSLLALLTVNASFLIRLTPGNVGVFQFLYALAATAAGLDRDGAVAVAILISFIQYIPVTSIGLVLASTLMWRPEPATPAPITGQNDSRP
jgi:uncharacterized protein (TIRG00374 family)